MTPVAKYQGYLGKGYELRARRTWPLYPPKTQAALIETPLDPPSWFPDTVEEWQTGSWPSKANCVVDDDTFLIGNHADELTVSALQISR
jgi:tRNASer (uridine44-2'-O)-methyltransferase